MDGPRMKSEKDKYMIFLICGFFSINIYYYTTHCKEIQPVHPKEDQSWVFIGRTEVEVETTVFWLPDAKCSLI